MRLLFISHLFPDGSDPWRGIENVALLQSLADRWQTRAIVLRHTDGCIPRAADVAFRPEFVTVPALNFLGLGWNIRRVASALRKPLDRLRRDWHFDAVLCTPLFPGTCAAACLASEFQFRFVALSLQDEAAPRLDNSGVEKIIASSLARAAGVVTDSTALSALLSKSGFRKDRMTLVSSQAAAAEACHRLLEPVRG
jgi:hypothetical protein